MDGTVTEYLHKQTGKESQADEEETRQKQEANWMCAREVSLRGLNYICIRAFNQSAGAGAAYALHTEQGQPVLILGTGAEFWTSAVYWRTEALARANKDKKFDDLLYQDDSWMDSGDSDDESSDDEEDSDDYDSSDEQTNNNDGEDEDTTDDY